MSAGLVRREDRTQNLSIATVCGTLLSGLTVTLSVVISLARAGSSRRQSRWLSLQGLTENVRNRTRNTRAHRSGGDYRRVRFGGASSASTRKAIAPRVAGDDGVRPGHNGDAGSRRRRLELVTKLCSSERQSGVPRHCPRLVKASNRLAAVPRNLQPPLNVALTHPDSNWGAATVGSCEAELDASTVPSCVFGDTHGTHTMVLYGDSHAAQWFDALNDIAKGAHWRLVLLTKGDCPAVPLSSHEETTLSGEYAACARWHSYAIASYRIGWIPTSWW